MTVDEKDRLGLVLISFAIGFLFYGLLQAWGAPDWVLVFNPIILVTVAFILRIIHWIK